MKKKANRLSRLVLMVITLIILLIPFALYYVFYVTSQQSYFIERSRRALASIGAQVVSRIDGLQTVVKTASQKDCENPDEAGDPIQDLFNPNTIRPFGVELEFVRFTAKAKPEEPQPKSSTSPKAAAAREPAVRPETTKTKPVVTLAFERTGSTNRIIFNDEQFSVAVGTEQLLGPVVDRFVVHDRQIVGEDLFNKVFVADSATGEVLFEYGLSSTTVANLDDLLGDSRKAGQGEEKAEGGQKPKEAKSGNSARLGRGSTSMISITIAETDHKLFFQPIELTVPKTGDDADKVFKLTVCGLVSSEHLGGKTFSFSYTLLLLAVLLLMITTVSGPLIKLKLMGPKDRLRKADAVLTACSAFFGTALVIFVLLLALR